MAVMVAKIGNVLKVLDSINKGDIQQVLQVSSMLDPDSFTRLKADNRPSQATDHKFLKVVS